MVITSVAVTVTKNVRGIPFEFEQTDKQTDEQTDRQTRQTNRGEGSGHRHDHKIMIEAMRRDSSQKEMTEMTE